MQVAVHEDQVAYLKEHATEFPGVQIVATYLRKYNTEALLAHVLGYVGEISPARSPSTRSTTRAVRPRAKERTSLPGDRVGQAGVEQSYDKYLRGRSGEKLQRVNSLGGRVGGAEGHAGAAGRATRSG